MFYCISHPPDALEFHLHVGREHRTRNVTDPDLGGEALLSMEHKHFELIWLWKKKKNQHRRCQKASKSSIQIDTQKMYKRLSARFPSTSPQERRAPWHHVTKSELWPPANLQQVDTEAEEQHAWICRLSRGDLPPGRVLRTTPASSMFCFVFSVLFKNS